MTPLEYLGFFYPKLAENCSGGATPLEVEQALVIAEGYIPPCLNDDEKAQAQALYAAHLLSERSKSLRGGSTEMILVEEAEASVRKRYQSAASLNSGVAELTPYDRWMVLKRKCRGGAILNSGWGPRCYPLG